ncbi:MAG TPA: polyphosphate polymerase domain-containing protein [Anaerolineales bacterium]|nr:polyphosphate polymerase domain-containing protein [Anaerolineales bacterium]
MKYRNELKYLVNYYDYTFIKLRLNHLLAVDSNADPDGSYMVRSLYFDDYCNHAYNEKMAGAMSRCKYRIRLYNHAESTVHLEKKIKVGLYNHKLSAALTRDQVCQILDGNYSFLLESSNRLLQIFYYECVSKFMRPRVIVDYEREAYVMEAGDVRVTFDKNVRAGVEGFDIFNREMSTVAILDPGLLIMEVKFTEFLPGIVRRILPFNAADYVASSKYISCCDKTPHKQISNT